MYFKAVKKVLLRMLPIITYKSSKKPITVENYRKHLLKLQSPQSSQTGEGQMMVRFYNYSKEAEAWKTSAQVLEAIMYNNSAKIRNRLNALQNPNV